MDVERAEKKKTPALDSVLLDMRERIFLNHFDTSRPITEAEISDMYETSRNNIRTALQTLESEGLIIITETGRKYVRNVDKKFVDDLYLTRIMLEKQAVEICIHQEIDYSILATAFSAFYSLYSYSGNALFEMRSKINTDFHRAILLATANIPLIRAWTTIEPLFRCVAKFNYVQLKEAQTNDYLIETHQVLMDLIFRRDPAATECIIKHIGIATDETIASLKKET